MGDSGFFRGTNAEQDNRFSNKEKSALKSLRFPENFSKKVNTKKVNFDAIAAWMRVELKKLMDIVDELLLDYVLNQLRDNSSPDPKLIQLSVTGFIGGKPARIFCESLWGLLLEAQQDPDGVPKSLIEAKVFEIQQKQNNNVNNKNKQGPQSHSLNPHSFVRSPPRSSFAHNRSPIDRRNRSSSPNKPSPPRRRSPSTDKRSPSISRDYRRRSRSRSPRYRSRSPARRYHSGDYDRIHPRDNNRRFEKSNSYYRDRAYHRSYERSRSRSSARNTSSRSISPDRVKNGRDRSPSPVRRRNQRTPSLSPVPERRKRSRSSSCASRSSSRDPPFKSRRQSLDSRSRKNDKNDLIYAEKSKKKSKKDKEKKSKKDKDKKRDRKDKKDKSHKKKNRSDKEKKDKKSKKDKKDKKEK